MTSSRGLHGDGDAPIEEMPCDEFSRLRSYRFNVVALNHQIMKHSARLLLRVRCALSCAALLSLVACGSETSSGGEPAEAPATPVIAMPVTLKADNQRIEAVGTARAMHYARIFPEDGGIVDAVNFKTGDWVDEGDVLIELEKDQEELAVRRAEIAVRDAQQLLDRYQRIDVEGAISDSQIDEARTALDGARIDLDLARVVLAERQVAAPFGGYVGLTTLDPGARVSPDTLITELNDRSVLYVDFSVPEEAFGKINPGDTLAMSPFSAPTQSYQAEIVGIDPSIVAETRGFTVRAQIDNGEDRLRPGMSFSVAINLPGERYPVVPEAAIVWGGDGAYLWAVRDGTAVRTPVTIVSRVKGEVLVRADLQQGDLIVAEGVQKVREGSAVDARRNGPAPRGENTVGAGPASIGAGGQ
ncbi:efflux RND transporter periplasmic adaptor subunit [Parvularcula sp. LCG005]|uniref:efflux RND transporter periplasmic adaptor subunit n=1 Tax=Parvularcula sp. LCG005 TaxID=3078805 RepID=UPI0029429E39|nr:efflux RND transporter periplasmic adaptor subunit [Parvularcula sp. LCG005]WOI54410.1 efflux RND transporter periplasmic adaptor subunit [Parvularcula sp. LCG005]